MKQMLVSDIVCVIMLLWALQFIVQIYTEFLAKKLYTRVTGTSKGYSWRKFRKSIDTFAVPPHEELAQKVKALTRLSTWLVLAICILFFLALLVKEFG